MSRTHIGPRIGVYPGSFNPFHNGHADILRQALGVFDEVYVAVGQNRNKPNAKESQVSRLSQISQQIPHGTGAIVEGYDMLLTEYIKGILNHRKDEIWKVSIIRGLRSGYDLEYEINFRKTIAELNGAFSSTMEFVYFLPSNPNLYHISSSMIRELASYDMDAAKKYIYNAGQITDEIFIS